MGLHGGVGIAGDGAAESELDSRFGKSGQRLRDEKFRKPGYVTKGWYPVRQVPATVLEILQEDGVYPNLYYGKNLLNVVPQDLYKQDWWYRTTFQAPAQGKTYWLEFPGINYRAEIWLNGKRIADNRQVAGMYVATELNVTDAILPGQANTLAVKVTPERAIQDINGVELADSWFDWLNGKFLGSRLPPGHNGIPTSFVSDRNAGIWKPVTLRVTGPVRISHPSVTTALPLPKTNSATLTVFGVVENGSSRAVRGRLLGQISRPGKPVVRFEQPVTLGPRESREVSFTPERFAQLAVSNPDLWWPYTMGQPNLYNLELKFLEEDGEAVSDRQSIRFGIRVVTQHRDKDEQFPEIGKGGNFYLQVNGKDFPVRGAVYTPDLLFRDDPEREAAILGYVKDLGLNMLRWESKISSEHMVELADEAGIPVMFGWMCCNQWEKWDQWDAEDQAVARKSLRSQISMLRSHPAVFIWANGSDGLPPAPVLQDYHRILKELHWQNAVVDTVSSFAKDRAGNRLWSGIIMEGPYSWRPPSYWFSGLYPPTRGSSAEQGDNEIIPPYESLKKFIPPDKLWPINDTWFFHAGFERRQQFAAEYPARDRAAIRSRAQRRGVRREGAARPLRKCPRPVREFRRQWLGRSQDDDLLDAEQSLALVLRPYLRLLFEAGRRLFRRQDGIEAAFGGVRQLCQGPGAGTYPRRQSDLAGPTAAFACGCASMIWMEKRCSTSAARSMFRPRAWSRPWSCPR